MSGTQWDEWVRLFATRDEIAVEYARRISHARDGIIWSEINAAIVRRWSASGLNYIKRRAWKLYRSGSIPSSAAGKEPRQ